MADGGKRIAAIDVMRGIAILSMVLIHFAENLAPPAHGDRFYAAFHLGAELLAAPVFAFLVGMSFFISTRKHGASDGRVTRRSMRRGVAVFVVGLGFALIAWGPRDLVDWDILTLFGFALVVLPLLRGATPTVLTVIAVAIVAVSPWLRGWLGFFDVWNEAVDEYDAPFTAPYMLRGFFVSGFFPVFPWLAFPILGFASAKSFFAGVPARAGRALWIWGVVLAIVGFGGMVFAKSVPMTGAVTHYVSNWTVAYSKYPATTSFIAGSLGLCLVMFAVLHRMLDEGPAISGWKKWSVDVLTRFSTYSLTVYVLHQCLHLWPVHLSGVLTTGDPDEYLANVLGFYPALGLGVVCALFFYWVIGVWERRRGKYSLEWCLAKAVG